MRVRRSARLSVRVDAAYPYFPEPRWSDCLRGGDDFCGIAPVAQSNQSAQAVESVEKTEVAKKAAKTASTRAAKNRYDFHSNQDNRNQAHDVSYGQNHSD